MKNKKNIITLILNILFIAAYTTATSLTLESSLSHLYKYTILISITFLLINNFIAIVGLSLFSKKRREVIKRSFDSYVEESVSTIGVGVIIFNDGMDIVWSSKFIEDRLNKNIIGTKLNSISDSFLEQIRAGNNVFRFNVEEAVFQARVDFQSKTVVLKDITNESMVVSQYENERAVVAELEIDNFQQFQNILPEEEQFQVQSGIIKMLDELVDNYNLTYRQYVNGKFLIYTNYSVLKVLMENKFSFFDKIRALEVGDGVKLSASMGVGFGTSQIKELNDLAKDGLMQAMARGGDQVAVMKYSKKPLYFGSKAEVMKTSSRVKIKQVAKSLEDKLKLKTIKKVVVYGHVYADLDAVGASLGVAQLAREYKKEVYIQNNTFDVTTEKAISRFISKEDQDLFIKKNKANKITNKKDTLVIIVDTAEMNRIENDKALSVVDINNVFIFDHHRVSKLPDEISTRNTYIDTSASSASEIITEVMSFMSRMIKPPREFAQMLLNGIYLDTKQFTKSVSSRTFAAASWLEKKGASPSIASDILKLPEQYSTLVSKILSSVKEIKKGYFLSRYDGEVPQDIVSLASDEILRVQGRKAAFVIAKVPNKRQFKLSARGIDTNVQVIAEQVGGGGHFGAAAAVSEESIDVFEDNIIQAIISVKGDK